MPFDEFDHRIREAAENHHPAYDEQAWPAMEKKLDEVMPLAKKDRRRILPFFLLFLVAGTGTWLLLTQPWKKNNTAAGTTEVNKVVSSEKKVATDAIQPEAVGTSGPHHSTSSATDKAEALPGNDKSIIVDTDLPVTNKGTAVQQTNKQTSLINNILVKQNGANQRPVAKRSPQGSNEALMIKVKAAGKKLASGAASDKEPASAPMNSQSVREIPDETMAAKTIEVPPIKSEPAQAPLLSVTPEKKDPVAAGQQPVTATVKKEKTKRNKSGKSLSWLLAVSAGPDASGTSYANLGRATLAYGIGAGVTLNKRWTIRTGFYTAQKLYAADSADYHPPQGWWRYYPNTSRIDADCRVYEVPLLISYNLGQRKNHNWLLTAGISSVYMKRETYTYHYRYGGWPVSKTVTHADENKHFLSVLTVSGGYGLRINKNISLLAEPYLKLPVSGIGFGKIKLNSAGVLFSVAVNPFAKK